MRLLGPVCKLVIWPEWLIAGKTCCLTGVWVVCVRRQRSDGTSIAVDRGVSPTEAQ